MICGAPAANRLDMEVFFLYRQSTMNTAGNNKYKEQSRLPHAAGRDIPSPNQNERDQALAAICKALGHPVRVGIVRHLMEMDECVCGNIVDQFSLAQSTISQHLKILKKAGVIKGAVEGTRVCYCLDRDTLNRFSGLLSGLLERGPEIITKPLETK